MHFPVLLPESLEYLAIQPERACVDATAGLGGHLGAIASRLTTGIVVGSDRDGESLKLARENTREFAERIRYSQGPFSTLRARLAALGIGKVSGLVADLGVSRYQLTEPERGFSLMNDGELDMRMDRSEGETAADIVNFRAEKEIANLIFQWGEERRSRQIARAIVRARPIRSTLHLARVVEQVAPRTGRLHPATQTFMALRLVVNREMEELESLLDQAPEIVGAGGRLVVIAFMSIEDRIVKRKFQEWARSGRARILTKHVVKPTDEEVAANSASRSARLRAVEMVS